MTLTRQRPARRCEGAREVTLQPDHRRGRPALPRLGRRQPRARSTRLTGGRVGYLHLPDMGADGIREFIKWFYPQIRKEGLVVDVRGNGGGNVSQMIIERLRRELLGTRFARNSDDAADLSRRRSSTATWSACSTRTRPRTATSSPHMFREAGLGPLIGKRSWGGVVGITDRGPADRRRHGLRARVRHQRRRRRVDHRGPRRRPRHRGRERPRSR